MKEIANFIPHCDDDHCNLGSFQYICPACKKKNIDYDIWFKIDDIHHGLILDILCEHCFDKLSVYYDDINDFCYYVDYNTIDPG